MNRSYAQANGQTVVFPGMDGMPFRGDGVPMLKEHEAEKLVEVMDAKIEVLDMSKEDERKRLESIWDRAAKGLAIVAEHEKQWSSEKNTWFVFIRYGFLYKEKPNNTINRTTHDGNEPHVR